MSPDERHAFLDHGTRTGKLATARADGAPHVAPIWFVRDGDDLVFTTGGGTVKGKALARDIIDLVGRFNTSGDRTMVVPSEYLEVVISKR